MPFAFSNTGYLASYKTILQDRGSSVLFLALGIKLLLRLTYDKIRILGPVSSIRSPIWIVGKLVYIWFFRGM